jgi:hypothetical protein
VAALALACAAWAGSASSQEPPAAAGTKAQAPPTADEIARWAAELDSDVFDTRENATLKLAEAGAVAIEPVKKVLEANISLESTTRSLHVLRELGMSNDLEVQELARGALEDLARKPTSIGRRASAAIAWLNEQRAVQTADALEKLGAIVNRTHFLGATGLVQSVSSVQIDDAWKGTEKDFRRLKWLQDVDTLVLVGERIGDPIMPHVAAMPGLKRLHCFRTKITDQGLAAVQGAASLTEVGIYYTPVGDGAAEVLRTLPAATSLKLYGTKVSPEAKERLAAALPAAKIDFRRGAFLGVGCAPVDGECMLSTVHEGSPADKAGLRPNDILVKFAGQKVAGFEDLTAIISQYSAGDEVEVEYRRAAIDEDGAERTHKTRVTLAEWAVDLVQQRR